METCLNTDDSPLAFIWTNATDTVGYVYVSLALNISNWGIWNVKFFDMAYFHSLEVGH